MKRNLILLMLSMTFLIPQSHAVITIDVAGIQRLIALMNILGKNKAQLKQLKQIHQQTKGTKLNTENIFELNLEIEEQLRHTGEFGKILSNSPAGRDVYADLRELEKLVKISYPKAQNLVNWMAVTGWEAIQYMDAKQVTEKSGVQMYEALVKNSTLETAGKTYSDVISSVNFSHMAMYGGQTAIQKRKMQLALTYLKTADKLEQKALSISEGIKSGQNGTKISIKNKDFSIDGLLDGFADAVSGGDISQVFSGAGSKTVNVGGQNFIVGGDGTVINSAGQIIGKDIMFGVHEEAASRSEKGVEKDVHKQVVQERLANFEAFRNAEIQNEILKKIQTSDNTDYTAGLANDYTGPFKLGTGSNGLRMTTGERIMANKASIDLYTKAQELREKADALLKEALAKTPIQEAVDGVIYRNYQLNELGKIRL